MKKYEVNRIKRQVLNKTQAEVAAVAGCSGATITKYESGGEVSVMAEKAITGAYDQLWHDVLKNDENRNELALEALMLLEAKSERETFFILQKMMYRLSKALLDYRQNFIEEDDRI